MLKQQWLSGYLILVTAAALMLSGCSSGTKLLKEPHEQPINTVLATVSDQSLTVDLDWVIIRDGPGAWARRADWDEYLLHISNQSPEPVRIIAITLVDALDTNVSPQINRKLLVKGSRQTVKRFKKADIDVHAGMTGAGLFGTSLAMATGGAYVALHSAFGALAGTTAGSIAGPAAVIAVYAAPVVMVGGVVRGVNNSRVNAEIIKRQTLLPHEIPPVSRQAVNVFFPISPSPKLLQIDYVDQRGQHSLLLDTTKALDGLHLEMADQEQP